MDQQSFRMIGEVRTLHRADHDDVEKLPTFRASLRYAINRSGLDQEAVADALGIDHSSFSRMLSEAKFGARKRQFSTELLADFCAVTGSLCPVQWICSRVGQEPVSIRETRVQRLERELAAARAAA